MDKLILRNITDYTEDELIKMFGEVCYTCDNLCSTEFDESLKECSAWCNKKGVNFSKIDSTTVMKCNSWVKINHDN